MAKFVVALTERITRYIAVEAQTQEDVREWAQTVKPEDVVRLASGSAICWSVDNITEVGMAIAPAVKASIKLDVEGKVAE